MDYKLTIAHATAFLSASEEQCLAVLGSFERLIMHDNKASVRTP